MKYADITVIIPTLNEGKNIDELLGYIMDNYPQINIIVTDDGSEDQTQDLVNKWSQKNKAVKLIDRENTPIHGLSASILDAIKQTKTRYFVVIDGDFQHPPERIAHIVKKLRQEYDIVVGTRESVDSEWKLFRRIESYTATCLGLIRASLTGTTCKDILSGFFGAKTNFFLDVYKNKSKRFELKSYKIMFDFMKSTKNLKVAQVPYVFDVRRKGESKIGAKHVFYFLKSLIR